MLAGGSVPSVGVSICICISFVDRVSCLFSRKKHSAQAHVRKGTGATALVMARAGLSEHGGLHL